MAYGGRWSTGMVVVVVEEEDVVELVLCGATAVPAPSDV